MKARDLAVLLALGLLIAWLVPVSGQPRTERQTGPPAASAPAPAAAPGAATRAVAPRVRPETFVRLEGLSGESPARPGWIEALSAMRFDCRGRSFAFVHLVDRTSPVLAQALAGGKPFAQAELELRGARYVLTDVLVSGITRGAGAGDRPAETVTLNFAKCARR